MSKPNSGDGGNRTHGRFPENDPVLEHAVHLRGMVLTHGFDAMSLTLGRATLHVTRDSCRIVVLGEGMREVSLPSDEDVLASADLAGAPRERSESGEGS